LLGIVAIIAVIVTSFALIGCDIVGESSSPNSGDPPNMPQTSGSMTINGLEDYNGKYIYCRSIDVDGGWIAAKGARNVKYGSDYAIDSYNEQISDGKAVLKVWKVVGNYSIGYTFENFTEDWPPIGTTILLFSVDIYSTNQPYGNTKVASGRLVPTPKFVNGVCTTSFVKD
jgi:hypothetical protein